MNVMQTRADATTAAAPIAQVALPLPLHRLFDYRLPVTLQGVAQAGARVRVPVGRTLRVGVIAALSAHSALPDTQIKPIAALLDETPLLDAELLASIQRAWRYWAGSPGEALLGALPSALRDGRALPPVRTQGWQSSDAGRALLASKPPRGAAGELLRRLASTPLDAEAARALAPAARSALQRMRRAGWIVPMTTAPAPPREPALRLNAAQRDALAALRAQPAGFGVSLLDGVTGSGKTAVYLARMHDLLTAGRQVLLLVPEIGLVAQTAARVEAALGLRVDVLHSGLSDGLRLDTWLRARSGAARILLGTRSAVFAPLPQAGLIVIDEEHDASYKQQEGLRYHARDLALMRAQQLGIPVLLGSATPALESLHNAARGRYAHLHLPARANAQPAPRVEVLDLRRQRVEHGLSALLLDALAETFARGEQALVFRNRRGYAPLLRCADCNWHADCPHCARPQTWHRALQRLECHLCGRIEPVPRRCPACGSRALSAQGHGTERLQEALAAHFPHVPLLRVDRETTRTRAAQESLQTRLPASGPALLVGTQMLAKGHDLPRLSLVAVTSVDEGLFSTDFRAPERLAQLIVQVAGRAGRGALPGRVLLQTRHPDHPLLLRLLAGGYGALADDLLAERAAAQLPPYAHHVLLRAEHADADALQRFLETAAAALPAQAQITRAGPMPAPLPRRGTRWCSQLLLAAARRHALHAVLTGWVQALEALPHPRGLRWSLDVDPLEPI